MKLEAVDRRNPVLIRVATIVNVRTNQLLIHFDGWSDMYDYWVDDDCPDVHPPGWCHRTGHLLTPPLCELLLRFVLWFVRHIIYASATFFKDRHEPCWSGRLKLPTRNPYMTGSSPLIWHRIMLGEKFAYTFAHFNSSFYRMRIKNEEGDKMKMVVERCWW